MFVCWGGLVLGVDLDLAGVGSRFFGKGTAETRLFGEGKCCIFRWVDLDRG